MAGKILDRIREYARQDKLKFSKHAYDEMQDDELGEHEVREAILKSVLRRVDKDALGRKCYCLEGLTGNFRKVGVVARLDENEDKYLIITVYQIFD
jgi:hypothetical protein